MLDINVEYFYQSSGLKTVDTFVIRSTNIRGGSTYSLGAKVPVGGTHLSSED